MKAERTLLTPYQGEIWDGPAVHPDLWRLLQQKDVLIEISSGAGPYQVALGAPHHAGPGVDRIAEDWINPKTGQTGRAADETTGLVGLAVFQALQDLGISCKLVIAAHPTDHDPNKVSGSPYWRSLFSAPSSDGPSDDGAPFDLLIELHGAAKRRRHALELSAGQNTRANPLVFGKALAYYWQSDQFLAVQEQPGSNQAQLFIKGQPGTPGRLENPALETPSLAYAGQAGRPALHLEMKADFRQPDPAYPASPRPTATTWDLARALANTIDLLSRPDDISISGADLGLPTSAFLTRPALDYAESYLSATQEAGDSDTEDNPDLRISSASSLRLFVEDCHKVVFDGLPEHPPEEYLWLIDRGEFIGRVFFLHWLNDYRLRTDGQVDYWIRPSKRRQGYGKLILRLLLARYRQLGLDRILISCRSDNLPSKKIIEANGGIFESEIETPDRSSVLHPRLRYWIDIP